MEKKLLEWLTENKISYKLHCHKAVYTVDEAKVYTGNISGMHCKNLFLKYSKTGTFYLVTLPAFKSIKILDLSKRIGLKKLSFAKPEDLKNILGLEPGSVSPLGMLNDMHNAVTYVIDKEVWEADIMCFHPNVNTETLEIPKGDFHRAINALGNKFTIMEF